MYSFDPGSVHVSLLVHIRDDTTGKGKQGLSASSTGAVVSYTRERGLAVNIPLVALSGPAAAWQEGGFVEVDPTLARGMYRLDPPDGLCAAGVHYAVVHTQFNGALDEGCLVRLQVVNTLVGTGVQECTITVTNTATAEPLPGALVWVTTDAAGSNVVAGALPSDTFGQVTFFLDPGTYYVWVRDPGFTGTNPTTLVVS